MAWEVLSIIGTVAFAISGAIVAMEEEYDILGVYILGIVTAFGGGAIRNLLIGVPVSALWEQGSLFLIALVSITIVFLFPKLLLKHWSIWGSFSDAIGLAAFAIQGALYAVHMNHPVSAVIVAAVLTGSGGGMIRDLFGRKKAARAENRDLRRLGRFGRIHYRHGLGGEAAHAVYPVCFAGRMPRMLVHV